MVLAITVLVTRATPISQSASVTGPWYVSPEGDDNNDCLTPTTSCATINGTIAKASSGDTIYVASGTYTGIHAEVVLLDRNVTLSGGWEWAENISEQSGASTLDGQGVRRGVRVASGVTATAERFLIRAGYANQGGGVYIEGILTLDNSTVTGNTATDAGGGIYAEGGAVTLSDSVVSGNIADDACGGVQVHFGTLILSGSTVSDNGANRLGGGICNAYGTVTLNSGTVVRNTGGGLLNEGTATLNNSAVNSNTGGGISNADNLTLNNCSVSGNMADENGSDGIHNAYDGILNVNNSTVSGNIGFGITNRGVLNLYNGTVSNNIGGGIDSIQHSVTLHNSILAGNGASGTGQDCNGTVNSSGYNLIGNLSGCTFIPSTGDLANVDPKTGPLVGTPGYHPLIPGSPAIDAGNPAGCTGSTGAFTTDQRGAARIGRCDIGAYEYIVPGLAASINAFGGTPQTTSLFRAFETPLEAVVLDSIGSPVVGATVTFFAPASGASGTFADSSTYSTTAETVESGTATAAAFTANGLMGSYIVTATVGGVVTPTTFFLTNDKLYEWYVVPDGSDGDDCLSWNAACATIDGAISKAGPGDTVNVAVGIYTGAGDGVVSLDKNLTLSGGWEWDGGQASQSGVSTIDGQGERRGITVDGGVKAWIEGFVVQNCRSDGDGGGILNAGDLTLSESTISGNMADNRGGGILNSESGALTVLTSTVSANSSLTGGGGIHSSGSLTLANSVVSDNYGERGGGIVNRDGLLRLVNSVVSGNGGIDGGGVRNSGNGSMTLFDSAITGNGSEFRGGGILNSDSGSVDINNSTVSGNSLTAGFDMYGGGIFNGSGSVTVNNGTVSENTAGKGGGIYNESGSLTLQNTVLAGNTALDSGADCHGTVDSAGNNLVGDTADCAFLPTTGDLTDIDPMLGPLVGIPGYHFLSFGSPAIDAGNPAGCTDHLGNPLDSDQCGAPRPLDGDGNGSAICDIGAYEFDPDNPTPQVFLAFLGRNHYDCRDFFDGFSDPASGWALVDDNFVHTEYLDGEYRVLSRQAGYIYLFRAPTHDRENFEVEVDARWVGTPGGSYGLIVGLASDFSRYYLFDINVDYKLFRLLRRDPTGFAEIVPITGCCGASAINGGTASNHLRVTRYDDRITLEVNGAVLGTWTDGTITGFTGVGLVSSPYSDQPSSDARFDNFSVICLSGNRSAARILNGAGNGEGGSQLSDAYWAVAPAEMGNWVDRDDIESETR